METQQVNSSRSTWVVVALAVVMGVVLGAIAAIVFWPEDSGAEAVTLEHAAESGDDPFTDSVQIGDVPVIEQPAVEAANAVRADLPEDEATSVLVATGTEPGLYGGSGDAQVCDAAKLVGYLSENPDKAQAFSEVLGITPEGIGDYVATLTPLVLLSDTLVTNHGFDDGRATALTSVLQAGTAVMVDQQGVPRVKCNCGNPLTPPQVVPSADWNLSGDAWDGFDAALVTGVVAGDTVTEFKVCDLVTGRTFTRPVGTTLTGGTPPPNIDGDWTIGLTVRGDVMTPLPPGRLDPRVCALANLEGALMVIRGTRASISGVSGFGRDLIGTVEGAPAGSPDYIVTMQQATNGAVIRLHPEGETAPEVKLTVATTPTLLGGSVFLSGAQDPSVRVVCDSGVMASRNGSAPAPTTTSTSSTTTTTPTTSLPVPTESIVGAGGPCDAATLLAVVQSSISEPVEGFEVVRCNERWAFVAYAWGGQDDPALLEWTGSAWTGGACQKHRDPTDWTKSPVVPQEFWLPCIVD